MFLTESEMVLFVFAGFTVGFLSGLLLSTTVDIIREWKAKKKM